MKRILTVILVVMLTMAQTVYAESCPEFNFKSRTVTLNSGYEMPILGLGMAACPTARQRTPLTGR